MRLHRFFVREPVDIGEIVFSDSDLANQLKNVFRAVAGYRLLLCDNSGYEFEAAVVEIIGNKIRLEIISRREGIGEPRKQVTLFVALPKKDKFEWILEKGTEIGVTSFVPIISDRTEKTRIRADRAFKIVKEASEQCGRTKLPLVNEPASLETVLEMPMAKIAFHPHGTEQWNPQAQAYEIGALIGPEGGWTERELNLITQAGVPVFSLGQQVLRTETAAVAAAVLLLL